MNHMQHSMLRVSQVLSLVLGLGAFISAQAGVPVESVQPSSYGSTTADKNVGVSTNSQKSQGALSGVVASLLNQVDSLQQQVQSLRGQVEEQNHTISQLQAQSKQRYLDLDRRLFQLTTKKGGVSNQSSGTSLSTGSDSSGMITDVQAYQDAFKLISQQKFDQAIAAFSDFITDYPKSTYIPNAKYWLGEIYSATGKADKARAAFLSVVTDYPKSNKVADSLYKLGQIYTHSGNKAQAKKYLQKVISNYPGSSAAQLSKGALKKLDS